MGLIPSDPESSNSWRQAVYVEANYLHGTNGSMVHIVDVAPSQAAYGDPNRGWTRLVIVTNDHGQVSVTKLP